MKKSERYRQDVHYVINKLELPIQDDEELRDEATRIYDEFHDEATSSIIRQFDEEMFARASIYLASQKLKAAVTMKELDRTDKIGDYVKRIRDTTDLRTLPTPAEEFVKRYTDEMDISGEIREDAIELADKYVSSRRPSTVAATAIYASTIIHGEKRKQIEMTAHTGVTAVSIRNCYEDMQDKLDIF